MTYKKTNGLYIKLTNKNECICSSCGSDKTYIKIRNNRGTPVWHIHNGNRLCHKCYGRLISGPKYNKKNNKIKTQYRLDYCGINLFLSFILPKEKCELCGVGKDKKLIHRHHYFYCRIMPWACTISICVVCHGNITNEVERLKNNTDGRVCLLCKTDNPTKNKWNKPIWLRYKHGHICMKCYNKIKYEKKSSINDASSTV